VLEVCKLHCISIIVHQYFIWDAIHVTHVCHIRVVLASKCNFFLVILLLIYIVLHHSYVVLVSHMGRYYSF
jgi:hypothetical protein